MTTVDDRLTPGDEQPETGQVLPSSSTLRANALGLPAIFFVCIAAIAPAASMLFNVPVMASQAGAATHWRFCSRRSVSSCWVFPSSILPGILVRRVALRPGCAPD